VKRTLAFLLSSFLFFSCGEPAQQPAQMETVEVYAASAAQPWLRELFACANEQSVMVNVTADEPDITLRVAKSGNGNEGGMGNGNGGKGGSGDDSVFPAYQIGEEEIVIVVHRESPIQTLTLEEARALFAGSGNESAQVWVYASGEDLQGVFDHAVMKGRGVTSFAKIAVNPQEMSEVLNSESNAVGILPQRWVAGNIRAVYSLGMFPVLAVTREEPQGNVQALLACLQRER
jgi:hypothetical protein